MGTWRWFIVVGAVALLVVGMLAGCKPRQPERERIPVHPTSTEVASR
jgi:hypothetical protein